MAEFTETIDVTGAFAAEDKTVIGWEGTNYYQACDEPVITQPDGSGSHCVKRKDHPGDIHEDFDGLRKTDPKGRMTVVVTFPVLQSMEEGYDQTRDVMQKLKTLFAGKDEVMVYGAIKEQADQIIMILDGDG